MFNIMLVVAEFFYVLQNVCGQVTAHIICDMFQSLFINRSGAVTWNFWLCDEIFDFRKLFFLPSNGPELIFPLIMLDASLHTHGMWNLPIDIQG